MGEPGTTVQLPCDACGKLDWVKREETHVLQLRPDGERFMVRVVYTRPEQLGVDAKMCDDCRRLIGQEVGLQSVGTTFHINSGGEGIARLEGEGVAGAHVPANGDQAASGAAVAPSEQAGAVVDGAAAQSDR